MKRIGAVLWVGVLMLTAGCGETDAKSDTAILPADAWQTYHATDGQFVISFPGYPKTHEHNGVKEIHVRTLGPAVHFDVKIADLSASDVAAATKNFDEFAKTKLLKDLGHGRVIDTRDQPYQDYPGRAVTVEPADGKGTIFRRVYLVKTRLYLLELSGPELPADTPYVGRFLDSFQIKAPPPPPPNTSKEAPTTKPESGGDEPKPKPPATKEAK